MKIKIKFENLNDVAHFVKSMTKLDSKVTLEQGRFTLDAKSILGVQTLNLNLPIKAEIVSSSAEERLKFQQLCRRYEI